jgi:hypothetical protein
MNSDILNDNGGLDSARARSAAQNILLNHDLKQPVLYHFVFTGSQSIATYQAVIKSLVRRIRNHGCRLEYFGAYEVEPEEDKGLHAHCFLLIETNKKTPFKILNVNDGEYLHKLAIRHKLVNADGSTRRIHIAKPKNRMHEGQFFARPTKGEKLDNCLTWLDYPFKVRSKDDIPSREKYFYSEFKANTAKRAVKRQPVVPSAPAVEAVIIAEAGNIVAPSLPLADSGKVAVIPQGSRLDGIVTMTSVEVVEAINAMRSPRMGKLDHDSFMLKVEEVLGPRSAAFLGYCDEGTGSTVKCYHLPERESNLMMMSDSLEVQTQVYDRLAKLEEEAAAARRPQTYAEALLELAEKVQKEEALQLANSSTSNPPALPVDYRAGPITNEGDTMTAAEQYVASRYEEGVDAGLDLDALRRYLLSHGIKRTPSMVVHELDETYGFHGYASSHPTPPRPNVAELDKMIDRMPERLLQQGRLHNRP